MHSFHCFQSSIRVLVIVLVLFAFEGLVVAQGRTTSAVYNATVRIEPDTGLISARMKVDFPLTAASAKDFQFNLHETFRIKKLQVNGEEARFTSTPNVSRFTPTAAAISVTVPKAPSNGRVSMEIEYEGKLKQMPEWNAVPNQQLALDDQVNSRMIELAGYSSWYPQFAFGAPVEEHLELSLPQGWVAVCSGAKTKQRVQDGRAITTWYSPKDLDMLIAASPDYKKRTARQAGVDIEIYYTRMPEKFIDDEIGQIAGAVQFYTQTLGTTTIPGGVVRQVYSPKKKGQGKAGIARPGLFLTSEGLTMDAIARDPGFSLFQPISHEIAHFWWNFGVGQGDWINEAFAEYFSALAVRNASGETEFQKILGDYKSQVAGLPADAPSLATVPIGNNDVGFVVRYYKGALMLDNFRQAIGDRAFLQASRDFFTAYSGKPTGTGEFRAFWNDRLTAQKRLMDTWMDSAGGVPAAGSK